MLANNNRPGKKKVVLVTGSATGVGRSTALRFARQGFDVVINYPGADRQEAEKTMAEVEACSASAILVRCDVSQDAEVVEMIKQIEHRWGRLDVVVNNAAVTQFVEHADLDGLDVEAWDSIFAVNTRGPFLVTRASRRLLVKQPGAAIVNVSSVAGVTGQGSSVAYCASKGALNTLTKSLSRALAPNIRVNAVCPGPIDSRWLRKGMTEEQIADLVKPMPIPRLSNPDEIADVIFYLATGTQMTTGQLLMVDGGCSI